MCMACASQVVEIAIQLPASAVSGNTSCRRVQVAAAMPIEIAVYSAKTAAP